MKSYLGRFLRVLTLALVAGTVGAFLTARSNAVSNAMLAPTYAAENGCSTRTLHGAYIYSADGYVGETPIAEAGVFNFDGNGEMSTSNTLSWGGTIIPRTGKGTYSVNADCTGSAAVIDGVTFYFVVTRSATEMRLVATSSGVSVMGSMTRQ